MRLIVVWRAAILVSAPLEHINVHARGGTVFTLQEPGYTTAATRNNSFALLITLDDNQYAEGTVYLDDGVSLSPNATKIVSVNLAYTDFFTPSLTNTCTVYLQQWNP